MKDILLGNAYDLIKTIPDKSVDLIYTDIPYEYDAHGYGKSALGQRKKNLDNNGLIEITNGIDYSIFNEFVRVLKYIYIYIYMVFKKTNDRNIKFLCRKK